MEDRQTHVLQLEDVALSSVGDGTKHDAVMSLALPVVRQVVRTDDDLVDHAEVEEKKVRRSSESNELALLDDSMKRQVSPSTLSGQQFGRDGRTLSCVVTSASFPDPHPPCLSALSIWRSNAWSSR